MYFKVGTELGVHASAHVCGCLIAIARASECLRVSGSRRRARFSLSGLAAGSSCLLVFDRVRGVVPVRAWIANARARPRESNTLRCIAMWNTSSNIYIWAVYFESGVSPFEARKYALLWLNSPETNLYNRIILINQ